MHARGDCLPHRNAHTRFWPRPTVYALGLYVDPHAAKKALHKHKSDQAAGQPMFDGAACR